MSDDLEQEHGTLVVTIGGSLRERRAKTRAKLHKDLPVPRYDPPIYVRFNPLSSARLEQAAKAMEKGKTADKSVAANAAALADACIGIFEIIDGHEVSVDEQDRDGDWPRFDQRLADILGLEGPHKGADIVRALYLTDGDIIGVAGELTEWSGFTGRELETDFAGN